MWGRYKKKMRGDPISVSEPTKTLSKSGGIAREGVGPGAGGDTVPSEYLRLKKIEEIVNEKIPLRKNINQTDEMLITLKEANDNILGEILAMATEEDSLLFKNVKNLFDRHFGEEKDLLEE